MDYLIQIFCTQEHKDTIEMLRNQMKSLDEMAEQLLMQTDHDDLTPEERVQIKFQIDQYEIARELVKERVKHYDLKRIEALN